MLVNNFKSIVGTVVQYRDKHIIIDGNNTDYDIGYFFCDSTFISNCTVESISEKDLCLNVKGLVNVTFIVLSLRDKYYNLVLIENGNMLDFLLLYYSSFDASTEITHMHYAIKYNKDYLDIILKYMGFSGLVYNTNRFELVLRNRGSYIINRGSYIINLYRLENNIYVECISIHLNVKSNTNDKKIKYKLLLNVVTWELSIVIYKDLKHIMFSNNDDFKRNTLQITDIDILSVTNLGLTNKDASKIVGIDIEDKTIVIETTEGVKRLAI